MHYIMWGDPYFDVGIIVVNIEWALNGAGAWFVGSAVARIVRFFFVSGFLTLYVAGRAGLYFVNAIGTARSSVIP